jgi:hypothetical protein
MKREGMYGPTLAQAIGISSLLSSSINSFIPNTASSKRQSNWKKRIFRVLEGCVPAKVQHR